MSSLVPCATCASTALSDASSFSVEDAALLLIYFGFALVKYCWCLTDVQGGVLRHLRVHSAFKRLLVFFRGGRAASAQPAAIPAPSRRPRQHRFGWSQRDRAIGRLHEVGAICTCSRTGQVLTALPVAVAALPPGHQRCLKAQTTYQTDSSHALKCQGYATSNILLWRCQLQLRRPLCQELQLATTGVPHQNASRCAGGRVPPDMPWCSLSASSTCAASEGVMLWPRERLVSASPAALCADRPSPSDPICSATCPTTGPLASPPPLPPPVAGLPLPRCGWDRSRDSSRSSRGSPDDAGGSDEAQSLPPTRPPPPPASPRPPPSGLLVFIAYWA